MPDNAVLVTGAHGFIGRHVSRLFNKNGWTVIGMGHGDWSTSEWKRWGLADWHPGDIDLDSLKQVRLPFRLIVHCAGSGSVGYSIQDPKGDFDRTVGTAVAVLEFIRNRSPRPSLVYPSSFAVYGEASVLPTPEDQPFNPISPYGFHKMFAEELCRYYGAYYGVSTVLVRLTSVYGNGLRKQLLWDACRKFQEGRPLFSGTGKETRDWLHVEDASELLRLAHHHASPQCPAVNGGSGVGASVREVLAEISTRMSRPGAPSFSNEVSKGQPDHYLADVRRVASWGWSPKIDWKTGFGNYVEWFLKEKP